MAKVHKNKVLVELHQELSPKGLHLSASQAAPVCGLPQTSRRSVLVLWQGHARSLAWRGSRSLRARRFRHTLHRATLETRSPTLPGLPKETWIRQRSKCRQRVTTDSTCGLSMTKRPSGFRKHRGLRHAAEAIPRAATGAQKELVIHPIRLNAEVSGWYEHLHENIFDIRNVGRFICSRLDGMQLRR